MTQPAMRDSDLIEQITGTHTDEDHVALWWLGQSGYVLRWRDRTVLLDPYLSDHLATARPGGAPPRPRLTAPPLTAELVTTADVIALTHKHADHCDPVALPGLMAASPQAVCVLPAALEPYAREELKLPLDRLVAIRDEQMFETAQLEIHAVPAAHEELVTDRRGNHPCLSYVVICGPTVLVFAGGTIPYRGQAERLKSYEPQIAFLPISGRDARRQQAGIPGNLTVAEAARLAHEIGAEILVPNHYGMFADDTGDPAALVAHAAEHYPHLRVAPLQPGGRWIYPGDAV